MPILNFFALSCLAFLLAIFSYCFSKVFLLLTPLFFCCEKKFFRLLLLFVILIFSYVYVSGQDIEAAYLNSEIQADGKICAIPQIYQYSYRYKLCTKDKGAYWFYLDGSNALKVGDMLYIEGQLLAKNIKYQRYLKSRGISGIIKVEKHSIIESDYNFFSRVSQKIVVIREQIMRKLKSMYEKDQYALLSGLTIGSKEGFSKELSYSFQVSGLSHIVVVSGSNISLLFSVFMAIFSFLGRRFAFFLSVILLFFYCLLVTFEPPVMRAFIMGVLSFSALQVGRRLPVFLAILFTMTAMLVISPLSIRDDVSFQLSYAALIGIAMMSDFFSSFFSSQNVCLRIIRESFIISLSAQMFCFPVLIYHFNSFSLLSPLVNLLVLPVLPLLLILTVISFVPLGVFTSVSLFFSSKIASYVLLTARIFTDIQFNYWQNIEMSSYLLILYYLILILSLLKIHINPIDSKLIS